MSKKTFVTFVLDETGSMGVCKDATISGFNEYVKSLQGHPDAHYRFTLLTFNSTRTNVGGPWKIKDVPPLTPATYRPDDTTPLYDTIMRGIRDTAATVAGADAAGVLFVILTDGQENASREATRDDVFKAISEKKAAGWTFVFLGANQDAYAAAAQIGVPKGNALNFDQQHMAQTMARVASATVAYTTRGGGQTDAFWQEDAS